MQVTANAVYGLRDFSAWMCIPTVIVVLGLIGATLSTFSHFFMDHFSVVLSSVVFLMLAEHVTLYSAAVSASTQKHISC